VILRTLGPENIAKLMANCCSERHAAYFLNISLAAVRRDRRKKSPKIPVVRVGRVGRIVYSRVALSAFMKSDAYAKLPKCVDLCVPPGILIREAQRRHQACLDLAKSLGRGKLGSTLEPSFNRPADASRLGTKCSAQSKS
jgi:hypothetical protein